MKKNEKIPPQIILSSKELDLIFLDNADLVRLLKVSPRTIYNMRKKNLVKYCKIGGKFFYPLEYIQHMMKIKNGDTY